MASPADPLSLYRELADRYDRLGQSSMRDRFLMLAASAALDAGQAAEAERLRGRLLQQNRHHMLRPYRSFEEAVAAPDVQTYLGDLKANYPPELAAQLLGTLKDGTAAPPKPLAQRRPFAPPNPPPQGIPPTAPVVDPYQAPVPMELPPREEVIPYKMAEDVAMTAPIPDLTGIPRPGAQPRPARPAPPRPMDTERPPFRSAPPRPQPRARPAPEPIPTAEPVPHPAAREETAGAWLCLLLMGLAATAGVLVATYTLARPFLPKGWLP
jgi:hypothetical protein